MTTVAIWSAPPTRHGDLMKSREIRRLRNELIDELALDKSATTETVCVRLCEIMAQRLQREIRLRFDDLGDGVSGLWAVTHDGVHVIVVTTARSWMHRLVILLHEIAHMLCRHEPVTLTSGEARRLFYPDLPPAMLEIIAGRTCMTHHEEIEADILAGELTRGLIHWAGRQDIQPFDPATEDARVARTWYALGYSPWRGEHGQ
ncbi:hypothetical protein [Amycolatopsis sp. NPDC059021]|uniref:hypothetical protein n=1 Tax=Amycolatopsis sp. NPDC059021 TaxID=3346704 RepID=UPI00366D0734